MSTTAISQSNGADLLNLFAQSVGQGSVTTLAASTKVLKMAIEQAALSASEIIDGNSNPVHQLNVFA